MKIRKAKNALKRLDKRIKGYNETVKTRGPAYANSVKRPGSMKK